MKKFLQVVHPDEIRRWAGSLTPLGAEVVPLSVSFGRVLAEEIVADADLPPFRRSTMDGYALRALETTGASLSSPAYLTCIGEVLIGREAAVELAPGQCCRISTGGMLPAAADAVVMVEVTRELAEDLVEISGSVAPGENVVLPGEDVSRGRVVAAQGKILRPQEVGVLAGLGVVTVPVFRRPRVAVLSTGDELVEPDRAPGPGQVRNINQYSLMAHVLAAGGEPRLLGVAPDDPVEIARRVREGLEAADVVIISGGSSVGTRDLTASIIESLGAPGVLFHGVAVRPGKPTIVGKIGERIVFGLPGHPISAMVSFINFVRPVLFALEGATAHREITARALLTDNIHSRPGREDYVQVALRRGEDGNLQAAPIFKKSGMITSMVGADGFVVIPAEVEGLEPGDEVEVRLYLPLLR